MQRGGGGGNLPGTASPNTVPTDEYELGFQGQPGGADLGTCDLGTDDISHSNRLLSAHNSLMHLRKENTTEADYTIDKEIKLGQHYDHSYEVGAEVPARRWVSDIGTYLSVSHLYHNTAHLFSFPSSFSFFSLRSM